MKGSLVEQNPAGITGHVTWELFDENGDLKASGETNNQYYSTGAAS